MKKYYFVTVLLVLVSVILIGCGNTESVQEPAETAAGIATVPSETETKPSEFTEPEAVPEIQIGIYTFGEGYTVEFDRVRTEENGTEIDFEIHFDLVENPNDYLWGTAKLGEKYTFDGYSANDEGYLIFTQKDGRLLLEFSSALHSWFTAELVYQDYAVDPSAVLSDYFGGYRSASGCYDLGLEVSYDGMSFVALLTFSDGSEDFGEVPVGEWGTLEENTNIRIIPMEGGVLHVDVQTEEYGLISDDFVIGGGTAVGNISYGFGDLLGDDLIRALAEVEQRSRFMRASDVIYRPGTYCDGQVYRFPGVVSGIGDGVFILEIADGSWENNAIICYSDAYVYPGEKYCVFGVGVGTDYYTKHSADGMEYNYETLAVEVGYLIPNDGITVYGVSESLLEEYVYGTYCEISGNDAKAFDSMVMISGSEVNGRAYSLYQDMAINFNYNAYDDNIGPTLSLNYTVSTLDDREKELIAAFRCYLDRTRMFYMGARPPEVDPYYLDSAIFERVEPLG